MTGGGGAKRACAAHNYALPRLRRVGTNEKNCLSYDMTMEVLL